MKLVQTKKLKVVAPATTKEQKKPQEKKSKLPSDEYKPLLDKQELYIDESGKLITTVQRRGDLGLPCVDIRLFQTTEAYTGYTKKGVNIPLNLLPDLIDILTAISDEAEDKGLYEEYEEE